jgi:ABC-type nitrate/sulfonate/bicarbonate transport system substrate-binding protein
MGGPLVLTMQKQKLIEAAAKELGVEVEPDFQDFQALLRMLQAVAAGKLQYGMLGSTPLIRNIGREKPAVPIAIAGGGLDFPLQVKPDSGIKNLDDLKGKTLITLVGSDLHLTFVNMLQAYFGTDDAKKLDITVKRCTAVPQVFTPQDGIDAYVGVDPFSLHAQEKGELVTLIHNNGTSGPAYEGPEGKGEGHRLEWFKNAEYHPEGFYPHRIWWVVRQEFLAEEPDAVAAFIVAAQRAATSLTKASEDDVSSLMADYWKTSDSARKHVVRSILWRNRGWTWLTEGDAQTLVGLSKVKPIFGDGELSAAHIKSVMALGADVTKRSYDLIHYPPPDVFTDPNTSDVRGLPQWNVDKWTF